MLERLITFSKRLILGTGGQASVSAANFIMSLAMMIKASPEEFGNYAFINVLIFLGFGVSNAVLSSPLMVALNKEKKDHDTTAHSFFLASILLGITSSIIVYAASFALTDSIETSLYFTAATLLHFLIRLSRTYYFDIDKAVRAFISDIAYAFTALIGVSVCFYYDLITLNNVAMLIMGSVALSYVALGPHIWKLQLGSLLNLNLKPFIQGFIEHGRHSLIGVLTTEATGKAHAYIVTAFLGAAAFAPLAAASLFFRPVSIVILSLTQFERGRLARLLGEGKAKDAWKSLRFFYLSGGLTLITNILIVVGLLAYPIDAITSKYDMYELAIGFVFFAVISTLQYFTGPISALLQANANFKILAKATVIASATAVPLVTIMVIFTGAIWSLLGVVAGEAVSLYMIQKYARKLVK